MDTAFKRKAGNEIDLETIADDIATLKQDLANILEHVKSATVDSALDTAQELGERVSDEAADLYKQARKRGRRAAKLINEQVEDQPGLSLLVAFALGFLASRLMR